VEFLAIDLSPGLTYVLPDMRHLGHIIIAVFFLAGVVPGMAAGKGVVNFGKVNDGLYRGGQPDALALRQLKAMGIKSIINLRMKNDVWAEEALLASRSAMVYTNIPLNSLAAPTDEQVTSILAAIGSLPKPVFIHCQFGCDRTGTIIACYRIQSDRWSNAKALKEAETYGISPSETEMREYIARWKR
jgi:protein tyrosine/serine phosphatase